MPKRTNRRTARCSGPCGEYKTEDAFSPNAHLAGGLSPWCRECVAKLSDSAEMREAYRSAYQKAYHQKRSDDAGGPVRLRWRVELPGGRAVVTVSRRTEKVTVSCRWKLREDAIDLAERLRDGAGVMEVHGKGGGRGHKQHRRVTVSVTGCATEATEALGKMETEGLATKLGRKSKDA